MKILIVEDDDYQGEWIYNTLRQNFQGEQIDWIKTEYEFRTRLDSEIIPAPPDVIVIDIMLRWTKPAPKMHVRPPDVKAEGFYRAGLRCIDLLQKSDNTRNIPVILYTVLDRIELKEELQNLRQNVLYLRKKLDSKQLTKKIRDLKKHIDKQV